ncbi:hypothetical protein HYD_5160 [Candidatus Hydrogenosomobacter endosymbioticus]|uniref:Methylated-DNA--[protein]-cysteine S-methyltransferase n=2 Tax=Candidatus Hydrogenosomobacter endosymbioticus TaxID=2558174 RepID=A0ABN6L3E3_9PROT|nr:hypothetical protein HYD_5160 [Candidatus Hydrogenosomobacter endosymbioticus]
MIAWPVGLGQNSELTKSCISTVLGPMVVVSDSEYVCFLEFLDGCRMGGKFEKLEKKLNAHIVSGETKPIESIARELELYFDGNLTDFKTPLRPLGSPFQILVWEHLSRVPYAQTRTYKSQAEAIGSPTSYRAVANANGFNQIAIAIPCHRIVNSNGNIGGYGGGVARKRWLIDHENRNA